jgi:hypothetical protein
MPEATNNQTDTGQMFGLERLAVSVLLGAIPPAFLFLLFWWGSIPLISVAFVRIAALTGLALGIVIDIFVLRKWVAGFYRLGAVQLALIHLFYSFCIFGSFMGVPVVNALTGAATGAYVGRRLANERSSNGVHMLSVNRSRVFSGLVMLLVCATSAAIALGDSSTPANLSGIARSLFGASLAITWNHVVILIVVGALALIFMQDLLLRRVAKVSSDGYRLC